MTAVVAAGRRVLPRGWTDFGRQLSIWFGFYFAYFAARSFADRNPAQAFERLAGAELRAAHDAQPRRDDDPAVRGLFAPAADCRRLDVLELGVHRRRARAPVRLRPPPRALRGL